MEDYENKESTEGGQKTTSYEPAYPKLEKEEKQTPFWRKHFFTLFLIALTLISFGYGSLKNRKITKKFEAEIQALNTTHQEDVHQLNLLSAKHIVSSLALAIRSEMIANNMNQVDQYFLQTLKNTNAGKVVLVNQKTGEIILSTNKKDEIKTFEDKVLLETKETITKMDGKHIIASTPIMGLNSQLATLIVEFEGEE